MRREKSRMVWFEGERPRRGDRLADRGDIERGEAESGNIESMERLPERNLI